MALFKCKMCGGTIEFETGATVGVCDSCGTKQTLPRLDDDRRANLYDRANHLRRNNEYDKAMNIYEQILNEDPTDAEAYWSLLLCKYGIEYVEDPATHKRVPTVNRAQFTSIFADENYKSAIEYADGYQKEIYEEEAKVIDEIQKGILAISSKEEPFDVFICYKETDANGRRTPDSVLATELYNELTRDGFKVFFSRITLEDKLGQEYEPYIFAALNSAKVMVVVGTKAEHLNAVWVKNEWSRFLGLIKNGERKILIPAYKDMDPYDLPEEFSHLQAQDMSRLGFMQDLLHGIKKMVSPKDVKPVVKETAVNTAMPANAEPLLKRVSIFLECGDWKSADEYCERILDIDPENGQAYLGKLLAELHTTSKDKLKDYKEPFDNSNNYAMAVRFNEDLAEELKADNEYIRNRNEEERKQVIYNNAVSIMDTAKTDAAFLSAANLFKQIPDFSEANQKLAECTEKAAIARKDVVYVQALSLL
nr:toll/interleukin-1 receptor domain-containing protein [Clostridiales bacterium]